MSLGYIVIYCFLGIILFLAILFLRKKYAISNLHNILFSIIIFLMISGFLCEFGFSFLNKNIFMIVIFEFIFDIVYTNYILEVDFFNKEDSKLLTYIVIILISVFLNNKFINSVDKIFLTGEELRFILWWLIILFLYNFSKKEVNLNIKNFTNKSIDENSIINSFTKLRTRYLDDVAVDDMNLELLIYSVMIYNNIHKSRFSRKFDNILYLIDGKKRKYGIMQVESNKVISDSESINIVVKDLKKLLDKKIKKDSYELALKKYMGQDNKDVVEIFNTLKKFFKL